MFNKILLLIVLGITGCICKFQDCGSKPSSVLNLSVSNCNQEDERCVLKKGGDATISITFTDVVTNAVKAEVCGTLSGTQNCIPFPLSESDGCKSGINCPVQATQTNTYSASISVLRIFPRVSVDVTWKLLDESGQTFVCALIPSVVR